MSNMEDHFFFSYPECKKKKIIPLTFDKAKKKIVMLPSPDQNLKIGSVGRFFFFFLRTVRELSFQIIFFKFSKWGKLGRNAVKTHIQVLF